MLHADHCESHGSGSRGKTLVAGVYGFNNAAQLTGTLVLNGQDNPNSVFIFNINSTLTTASASSILLTNGAQASHVFFRVGSSATLGTSTSFQGDILALTSITLDAGATIICGDALAQNGAVTLNGNTITICTTSGGGGSGGRGAAGSVTGTGALAGLPANATANERAVAIAIDNFVRNGGTLSVAFANLIAFSPPTQLAAAFDQLSGEAGTGAAQAGTQVMNSFLSLATNPFIGENRPYSEPVRRPLIVKGPLPADPAPAPSRWNIWAAGYGGQGQVYGDPTGVGSHDRSVSMAGSVVGLDYLVLPNTVAGFALGGGGARFGLSDASGSGHSDMADRRASGAPEKALYLISTWPRKHVANLHGQQSRFLPEPAFGKGSVRF